MDEEFIQDISSCLSSEMASQTEQHSDIIRENSSALCIEDIDSGIALEKTLGLYAARIRQLKAEISHYKKETDEVVDQNLISNLELIALNQELEVKVKQRTRELENANEKLSELNAVKESLMHMIVHDMKNPLTAILGTLSLFERNSFGLKSELHELLIGSLGHGHKLLDMIEGILFISRMKTKEFRLKLNPTNLIALMRQSIALMSNTTGSKQLTFNFSPPCDEFYLSVDEQIIERVIHNLLNNAIKYSPAGHTIEIEFDVLPNQVSISVTNIGEPIPVEHHLKIFNLFSRVNANDTQLSGTGIGLNFCKLAIEAHHGDIRVVSPVPPSQQGVKFIFTLPRA